MSDDDHSKIARFLYDHPRMMGVLFTLAVLLTTATPVVADQSCGGCSG